jgi:tripartite-type tricarboxylate transporter receptor subunit TctC
VLKTLALTGALLLSAAQIASPAMAQEYPKKQPVKIVVPVPAGGLTDAIARVTAEFLQRRLGQAVVVENRPGASSTIGSDYVAKSPPDGYTLLLVGAELAVLPAVRSNLPYKLEDFTFLTRPFVIQPLVVVGPKSPISSVDQLVTHMKANPGKVRYGSTGVGAIVHMASAMFEGAAGVKGVHVPYGGVAPAYTDLLAGNIDVILGGTVPFPEGLKVLSSTSTNRSPAFPDKPSLAEVGYKNATWDVWFGLLAPANLPKPIQDRLLTETDAMYKDPEVVAKFNAVVKASPEANPLTGEAFKKQALEEQKNWKTVAEREKVVVQQ